MDGDTDYPPLRESAKLKRINYPDWHNVKHVELRLWKRHASLLITVTYKGDNISNTGIAFTEFKPRAAS